MIDFGTPFDSALQRTKSILFGPFDFGKWLALAFTAWMAQCSAGLISLVQTFGNPGHQPWNGPPSSVSHIAPSSVPNHPPSLIDIYRTVFADQFNTGGLIFVGIMLVFGVVLAWVAMRGKFMFLDNLVFNRAEIKAPWRKFRRQANSLFLINILIGFIFLVGMVIFVGLCISSSVLRGHIAVAMTLISALVLLLVVILPAWIFTILYNAFAVPVMYCTGCLAREALGRVWRMIMANKLNILVYILVMFVLGLGIGFIAMTLVILTCCVGLLPYVSSVLLLPLVVFSQSYLLDCLRQFDPEYEVWRMLAEQPQAALPIEEKSPETDRNADPY